MLCPCIKMRNSDWRASAFLEAPFRRVMNILLGLAQMCRLGDARTCAPPYTRHVGWRAEDFP